MSRPRPPVKAKSFDRSIIEGPIGPAVWKLALQRGGDTLAFVRSFRDMQRGYARGCFRYAMIVAER